MTAALKLPPKLDLSAAESLLAELCAAQGDLDLDASEVTHFGALAAQTILVAASAFRDAGRTLRLTACSDATQDNLARMGLSPETLGNGALT
jgi:chemotaxis protein CheX